MAFIHGIGTYLEGSAGAWTYYRQQGKEIAKQKNGPNKSKSKKQLDQRSQIANPGNVWLTFDKKLKPSFEEERRKPGQSNFSCFISRGMLAFKVYLPKEIARLKGCVAAPYMISEGSLPTIETESVGQMLVSSLCLGNLQINASTKVAEFFIALYLNNKGRFSLGDQLQFYRVSQKVAQMGRLQVPRVTTYATRVVIDLNDDRTLYAAAGTDGFVSTRKADGKYYLSAEIQENTLIAWMQSRLTDDNKTLVSTQTLVGDNEWLAPYTDARAMYLAAKSYGPAKEEDYVTPGSTNEEDMIEELIRDYEQNHGTSSNNPEEGGTGNTSPTRYTISATVSPAGSGTVAVSPAQPVASGTTVTLTPHPNSGKRFVRWSDGNTQNPRTITATASQTFTAIFEDTTPGGGSAEIENDHTPVPD